MTDATGFVEERLGAWLEFRRDLHRHPELGFTEYRTQAKLAQRLEALGYRLRVGGEGMRREAMLGVPGPPALAAARATLPSRAVRGGISWIAWETA